MQTAVRVAAAPRPAAASLPSLPGLLARLRDMAAVYRQRRALARLDAALLADIGLDRDAALDEAGRPFWDAPRNWRR